MVNIVERIQIYSQISAWKSFVYTGLMGLFEKRRFRSFLQFVDEFDPEDVKTWKGFDAAKLTMSQCYEKFGLDENTADFTGHALALYRNDESVKYLKLLKLSEIFKIT